MQCTAFFLLAAAIFMTGMIEPPLGLPTLPWPDDNPYSKEKADLGRLLYFDKRLSSNGMVSCATCHAISKAYTDNEPVFPQPGSLHFQATMQIFLA